MAAHGATAPASDQSPAFARIPAAETAAAVIDLCGAWQFKACDEEAWLEGNVPGVVMSDLRRSGRIPDPFFRDNELKLQWVEKKEWEYRRRFTVDEAFLGHDRIFLECLGLDTVAEIYLNGRLVAETRNMFREYRWDAGGFLQAGDNVLHVIFRSVLAYNDLLLNEEPPVPWGDEKGVSFFVRKCGTDYGWNWGPRLLSCGIWRPVRLVAYDKGRITDLLIRQDLSDPEQALLDISAGVEAWTSDPLDLRVEVTFAGEPVAAARAGVSGGAARASLLLPRPRLWWPNGWGDQPLYTVTASLHCGETEIHLRSQRLGLRSIELCREDDPRGQTFGFKVNGHPIFCKGANWIPCDVFHAASEGRYRRLLSACKEAGMNMIRLWGGGIYEAECFYDYCDENGIMIWHDFMFAVGPYRADEWYLGEIRAEIADVVRRLRHHPSIALWCGNNEQESSMPKWLKQYEGLRWRDFERIFHETIPETAREFDPDRPYWPGSPHHPLDRLGERTDYETASGDVHLWDAWHGGEPFSWYTRNNGYRFVSEFGHQAMPHPETLRGFTAPEDRSFPSPVLDLHNKVGRKSLGNEIVGNERLASYLARYFKIPCGLENWSYVTQIMQGEAMKTAVEAFRRNYPATTGALYWQANDNWPAISGSGLDYYGRWKALHYMACRFFHPILVCGWVEGTTARIWGVNDLLDPVPARFRWKLMRFDGGGAAGEERRLILPPNTSTLLAELDLGEEVGEDPDFRTYRNDSYERRSRFYLAYDLTGDEGVLSANVSFFVPPKYLALENPELTCQLETVGGRPVMTLAARRFAAFVELGLKAGYARFSDNYFHLPPGETRRIEMIEAEAAPEEAVKLLCVKSLVDTYRIP